MNNLICTTLAQEPSLYKDVIALIEKSFGYPANQKFEIDFYPLICQANWSNNIILVNHSKQLLGHIGVNLRELGTQNFNTPVALLGGIAIDPAYRGAGHLNQLFNYVINKYLSQVSCFLLWSNLDQLYQKFSFHQFGGMIQTGTHQLPAQFSEIKKCRWSQITAEQFEQCKSLYNSSLRKDYTTFARNDEDWERIRKISSTDLYFKENERQEMLYYFCANKGFDLNDVIHEIAYQKEYKEELLIHLKDFKQWIPEEHNHLFACQHVLYAGLIRLGDSNRFTKFINQWSNGKIKIQNLTQEQVEFLVDKEIHRLNHLTFVQNLFGPNPIFRLGPSLFFSGLDTI